ncbi:MAG: cob(I)yrinic acid a,c-diamide adenosyltransferase [Prevotellaceae bacterium]|jgi:cob(I)alamin adenosyltransferase|nr:cob(I)yrinic acid a,c-diamide adenosyltransferase [Prevotellaceae bacterium]
MPNIKIYTKTGDKGTTALIGGTRVSKDSPQVEAYGAVDELISWIGVLRAHKVSEPQAVLLRRIQECLMTCAALLAAGGNTNKKLPDIAVTDIGALEKAIDAMQNNLPPLKAFVLPAAPSTAAFCHVARSVCRRAERCAVTVAHQSTLNENVLTYLNRLSDFLFSLARQLSADAGMPDDYWLPE